MKIKRLSAIFAFLLSATQLMLAQNGTMTPYSAYGIGILNDRGTSMQRSMGGVGYAMNSGRQINTMNPASYAAIDSMTFLFDIGIDLSSQWQSEKQSDGSTLSNKDFNGSLDYVTMQFPLGRYMGASVGLLPFSSVGYAFGNKIDNGIDSRQGSGSLSELYVGIAGRPFKGFTVGANFSYLFGTLLNETYAKITSSQSSVFQRQFEVRDYRMTFGAQYSLPLGANRLTAGVTYTPGKTLLGHIRQVRYDNVQDATPQTTYEHPLKDNFSLPETWGAGIGFEISRQWMFEVDYTYQPWSKAKFTDYTGESAAQKYVDRTKFAAGLQFTPDWRGGYGKRMNYRIGGYWSNDYLELRGNRLRQYSLSAGIGFPVPTFKTTVNLGFEWVKRAAKNGALIKEDYFNITIGVNFNEMWFHQRKIY